MSPVPVKGLSTVVVTDFLVAEAKVYLSGKHRPPCQMVATIANVLPKIVRSVFRRATAATVGDMKSVTRLRIEYSVIRIVQL